MYHLDIKPCNILMTERYIKIIDVEIEKLYKGFKDRFDNRGNLKIRITYLLL